jgi:hypothetical protein
MVSAVTTARTKALPTTDLIQSNWRGAVFAIYFSRCGGTQPSGRTNLVIGPRAKARATFDALAKMSNFLA